MLATQTHYQPQPQEIQVTAKSVYGVTKFYPECRNAQLFASIANTKTLTNYTLQYIKSLGYKIIVQQEEIKV